MHPCVHLLPRQKSGKKQFSPFVQPWCKSTSPQNLVRMETNSQKMKGHVMVRWHRTESCKVYDDQFAISVSSDNYHSTYSRYELSHNRDLRWRRHNFRALTHTSHTHIHLTTVQYSLRVAGADDPHQARRFDVGFGRLHVVVAVQHLKRVGATMETVCVYVRC